MPCEKSCCNSCEKSKCCNPCERSKCCSPCYTPCYTPCYPDYCNPCIPCSPGAPYLPCATNLCNPCPTTPCNPCAVTYAAPVSPISVGNFTSPTNPLIPLQWGTASVNLGGIVYSNNATSPPAVTTSSTTSSTTYIAGTFTVPIAGLYAISIYLNLTYSAASSSVQPVLSIVQLNQGSALVLAQQNISASQTSESVTMTYQTYLYAGSTIYVALTPNNSITTTIQSGNITIHKL